MKVNGKMIKKTAKGLTGFPTEMSIKVNGKTTKSMAALNIPTQMVK